MQAISTLHSFPSSGKSLSKLVLIIHKYQPIPRNKNMFCLFKTFYISSLKISIGLSDQNSEYLISYIQQIKWYSHFGQYDNLIRLICFSNKVFFLVLDTHITSYNSTYQVIPLDILYSALSIPMLCIIRTIYIWMCVPSSYIICPSQKYISPKTFDPILFIARLSERFNLTQYLVCEHMHDERCCTERKRKLFVKMSLENLIYINMAWP